MRLWRRIERDSLGLSILKTCRHALSALCHNLRRELMPPVYYHEGKFPPDERLDWSKLIPLIGRAAAAVARYDGVGGAAYSSFRHS